MNKIINTMNIKLCENFQLQRQSNACKLIKFGDSKPIKFAQFKEKEHSLNNNQC